MYEDRTLACRDCSEEFTFSAGEQAFFASKGLQNDPQRCPSCRAAAKRARTVGGPREFHAAVCGACGGQAIVPFAPRNDRPVYRDDGWYPGDIRPGDDRRRPDITDGRRPNPNGDRTRGRAVPRGEQYPNGSPYPDARTPRRGDYGDASDAFR